MCLGIPGEVIEFLPDQPDLARVDVSGVRRVINIGLLADDPLEPGDWVLIHVGFALSKIDEEEAAAALQFLEGIGQAYDDELAALRRIADRVGAHGRCGSSMSSATPTRPTRSPPRSPALCEPGRQYKFMEVCGGHTHTIYKHGLEDYLPEQITLVHGPGCPVCVIPMGRVDDAMALAARAGRDHDLVRRHDAGAGQPRLVLRRQGARHRHPDGLLAAGLAEDRPAEPGQAGRLHGDRVRDHRAVHRDDAAARARPRGWTNFSVFCNHVTIIPAIKAILDSPDLRLDGFIGPGHVSTVIGCRPYEFIARDYGKPVVVAGFEPLDILQSIYMLMRAARRGPLGGREPVLPGGAVGRQPGRAQGDRRRRWSCGRTSSGAASASSRTPR